MRLFILLFILVSQNAWCWGIKGHRVVGQIAQNNLSVNANKEVMKLLQGSSLASISIWADIIKFLPLWSHTKPWHYVSIPDGRGYNSIDYSHEGDVVTAIREMVKVLKDSKTSLTDKRKSLIFLVHFVGDIHQPLHVGRPDDRGGNEVIILFKGNKTNLHEFWDSILISQSSMNYVEYAASLESDFFVDVPTDISDFPFDEIIAECMAARISIYDFRGQVKSPIKLDADYLDRNLTLMNIQLLKGGKRLAAVLNKLFEIK